MNSTSHKRIVYVGGLDETVNPDLLRAAFIPFGEIVSVTMPGIDFATHKHKGFGFVEFENVDDAHDALDNMNHAELMGKVVTCTIAKPAAQPGTLGKPIWEQEAYLAEQAKEQEGGREEQERVRVTEVPVNAPLSRTREDFATFDPSSLPAPPEGFTRCRSCGGWGTGLVKENGLCNHCNRLLSV